MNTRDVNVRIDQPLDAFSFDQLWCPFPARINPYATTAQRQTVAWLGRWGMLPDDAAARRVPEVGCFAGRMHPDAAPHLLQLTADLYAWIFFQDDRHDEGDLSAAPHRLQAHHARCLRVLRGHGVDNTDEPMLHALNELRTRWVAVGGTEWMERFVGKMQEFFTATLWEANNRVDHVVPSVARYTALRPVTAGLGIEHAIAELVDGVVLPPHVQCHPALQCATQLADHAVCWANDLISFPKELQQGDVHNLVVVLKHEWNVSLNEAVAHAIATHDAAVGAFMALLPQLPPAARNADATPSYTDMLQHRMRGHLDWMVQSARYQRAQRHASAVNEAFHVS